MEEEREQQRTHRGRKFGARSEEAPARGESRDIRGSGGGNKFHEVLSPGAVEFLCLVRTGDNPVLRCEIGLCERRKDDVTGGSSSSPPSDFVPFETITCRHAAKLVLLLTFQAGGS
ncbi:hypothetical protein R1flu_009938 [Riccia fluitans]|uniref:Uncharacterized protein n=1 Tax=Riccia fluitans TaxID=41844 RepID=A0ABD1Z3K7_9MARC